MQDKVMIASFHDDVDGKFPRDLPGNRHVCFARRGDESS
jgi:hypothetical protein